MEREIDLISHVAQQSSENPVANTGLQIGAGLLAVWWLSNPRRRVLTYYTMANIAQSTMPYTGLIGPASLEFAKNQTLLPASFPTPLTDTHTSLVCGASVAIGGFYATYQHGPLSEMYARDWNSIQLVQYRPLARIAINCVRSAQAASVYALPALSAKALLYNEDLSQPEKVILGIGAASFSIAVFKALKYKRYGFRTFSGF